MTKKQWENYFIQCYELAKCTLDDSIKIANKLLLSCGTNNNIKYIIYCLIRYKYTCPMITENEWKKLFRVLLDYTISNIELSLTECIDNASEICNNYNSNDIVYIFYYIIKETKQC